MLLVDEFGWTPSVYTLRRHIVMPGQAPHRIATDSEQIENTQVVA